MRMVSITLLSLFMAGSAMAATVCPDPKDIKEASAQTTQDGFDGYEYSAMDGKWKGFAANADDKGTKEIELGTLKLDSSREGATSVICRYMDAKKGGLSLSSKK
ncbi:hypothetical protein ACK2SD_00165 [Pseudomonas sp. SC11]|uniref:hypothetical protein n=1 Tax=Pseudomonas sp. SC11 TaxID=326927 RepID=UPI00399A017D